MIHIKVRLFGVFKNLGDGSAVTVDIKEPISVGEFRKAFADRVESIQPGFDVGLIRESVFATDEVVLQDDFFISRELHLAILPPVCGG